MSVLETLILGLPGIKENHPTHDGSYRLLKEIAEKEVASLFASTSKQAKVFGPFGKIIFPYFKMGAIDSLDLFGLDELILFSFYWINRERYKCVLDIGGNIGLHSIVLGRCGYDVKVFEPDPIHFAQLKENLSLNNITGVTPFAAAVSSCKGNAEFVRVLGNTTSSHLKGSKQPYGQLESFSVKLEDIKELIQGIDLIKMDVEGHEKELLLALQRTDFKTLDILVEVGSPENAKAIFEHIQAININAFAQKKGWQKVERLEEMPTSHRDGSLFLSTKAQMPWN